MSGPIPTLFVTTYLGEGGAERFLSTLLRFLDRSVIAPAVCSLRDRPGYRLPEDVSVQTLGWTHPWHLPRTVTRLRSLIEATQPQIVVGTVSATNIVVGHALRGCANRPRWLARIGNNPARNRSLSRDLAARPVFASVDRWIVNSEGLVEELERKYPFASERVGFIYNPVDFEEIDQAAGQPPKIEHSKGSPLIISVGRLAPQKRFDMLIDAFSRTQKATPAQLWICGDGPDRTTLQRRIEALGLSPSARLTGFVENPFALLKQATLFALSSDYEGLPNALVEAQGLGLPAVSTRCPYGPEEIIDDGGTGLLTPVGDARALADSLGALLSDETRVEAMGQAARAKVRAQFAAERQTRLWEQALQTLAEG